MNAAPADGRPSAETPARSLGGTGRLQSAVRCEMQVRHWKLLAAYLATALVALLLGMMSAMMMR